MAEVAEVAEVAESQQSTTAICAKCGAPAGEFFNAWHKITTSYFLPALVGSYRSRLRPANHPKRASAGSALTGCTVDPLQCAACDTPLRFHLLDSPPEQSSFRSVPVPVFL
ncbi:hypothetical protein P171DRAFT_433731 [Karstenula rhodostoma CBS 690.94]|uniref:Uncharacterized protein n=1 Tax=Karstenula rhodostoma CBS 690.94 TaxID=1392251 RepID=A0A9P4PFF6_9PLEO|nr:hypothetical protein P171DRAFT_433731 [Karstenula rhodostoma CBS 690.94]